MNARDDFALAALSVFPRLSPGNADHPEAMRELAERAYQFADIMIDVKLTRAAELIAAKVEKE